MMYRVIRVAQIFFLFLAVTVLNAHMIIPHDHHQADSDFCSQNSYPVSKTGSTHHQGLPGHCHAFNDLTSEKVNSCLITKLVLVRDLILNRVPETEVAKISLSLTRLDDIINSPVIAGPPRFFSLRAPPRLS
jgi:hypothetical protein